MFAGWIFQKYPFFNGEENFGMVDAFAKTLGSAGMLAFVEKYNATLSHYNQTLADYPGEPWTTYITESNKHLVTDEAIDLLSKMMIYDLNERILPSEAMDHPYFDPVKLYHEYKSKNLSTEAIEKGEYTVSREKINKALNIEQAK